MHHSYTLFQTFLKQLGCVLLILSIGICMASGKTDSLPLDQWEYIQVDDSRAKWGDWNKPGFLRSFGLDAKDINGDGNAEIVAGRYIYINPTGDLTEPWKRVDFGLNVDGLLIMDVDGDDYGDVIAAALPDIYWLEATDIMGHSWNATKVASIPATGHVNGQGYALKQVIPGGKPEIILAGGDGIYLITVPESPLGTTWESTRIAHPAMDEGFDMADFDGDGDLDLAAGLQEGKAFSMLWFSNPGDGSADWPSIEVSTELDTPDRIVCADFNGDGMINTLDLNIYKDLHRTPPGPSCCVP